MTNKNLFFFIVINAIFSSFALLVYAQIDFESILNAGSEETFFIELIPEFPTPNQNVVARLGGFSFDLDRAEITWFHNGKIVQKGLGLLNYDFTTGRLGEEEIIRVIAVANGSQRHEASLTIRLADIDFLWRAETSKPAWYKGRSPASLRSNIIVSAFPHLVSQGREIPASQLIYRWSLDGDFKQSSSGAGKQNFSFQAESSSGISHEIQLKVSNINENITSQKTITIPIHDPQVLFYEEHPLEGPRTNFALDSFSPFQMASGEEKTFRAEPFYFSLINNRALLDYTWTTDGKEVGKTPPFHILNLSAAAGSRGIVSVDILVNSLTNILQRVKAGFRIDVQ